MSGHEHYWGRKPAARLNWVEGHNGPVEVYDCACGARRVMRSGMHPDTPVCDVREVAYNQLQNHDNWATLERTGGGQISAAMWLTEQQEKSNG